MITSLTIGHFKSLDDVTIPLGQVNVFIGPNGGGKSNLLEALGVLSAAASGRVEDSILLARGVRTGLPSLYKSAFPSRTAGRRQPAHIFLGAQQGEGEERVGYEVTLNNPLNSPEPAWRYKHEKWFVGARNLASRSPRSNPSLNPALGLAALRAVEQPPGTPGLDLLEYLRHYVIYTPTTPVMRGIAPDAQPQNPLGLSGGRLADGVQELLRQRGTSTTAPEDLTATQRHSRRVNEEALSLIDWADAFGSAASSQMALSPAAATSPRVVRFRDRFMLEGRNTLSGYDASEGALYVLFLAVLAAHREAPALLAVDNADHGLNPRLLRGLIHRWCDWLLDDPRPRQALLTVHNPLALDGLPLQDDRVRLFTVARNSEGRTQVQRVRIDERLKAMAAQGWTLSRLWVTGYLGGVSRDL